MDQCAVVGQALKAAGEIPSRLHIPAVDAVAAQKNRVQRGIRLANWLWLRTAMQHPRTAPRRPAFLFERWKEILRRTVKMRAPQSEFPDHPLDQTRERGEPSKKKRKANFTGAISTVVGRRNETITELERLYKCTFKSDSCPARVEFYGREYTVDSLWNLSVEVERGVHVELTYSEFHFELESLDRALVTDLNAEAMSFRYSNMELFFGMSSACPWYGSYPL